MRGSLASSFGSIVASLVFVSCASIDTPPPVIDPLPAREVASGCGCRLESNGEVLFSMKLDGPARVVLNGVPRSLSDVVGTAPSEKNSIWTSAKLGAVYAWHFRAPDGAEVKIDLTATRTCEQAPPDDESCEVVDLAGTMTVVRQSKAGAPVSVTGQCGC
jgi:hypothetical protein